MPEGRFRLATFNIRTGIALDGRHLWPLRRRSLLQAIKDLDADVIGLQEVLGCQRRWLMNRLHDYGFHGSGRSRLRTGEASPLLVRNDNASISHVRTRWFGPSPERPGSRVAGSSLPRVATTGSIRFGSEAEVEVTSLHLDHRSEAARRTSTEQLLEWLDMTRPQVVMGDFNASTEKQSLSYLCNNGFRSVLGNSAPGTFHGFSGRSDRAAIDHILINDRLDVAYAAVIERPELDPLPSDHWPVVADLTLRA